MQIGEVASFQNGYAFKSKDFVQDGKYKIIKIKELKDGKVRFFNDSASVNVDDERIIEKYIAEKGDVLFALTGDPVNKNNPLSWVGRVSVYEDDQLALLNQRVCKLVPKEGLNAKYIYYYFSTVIFFSDFPIFHFFILFLDEVSTPMWCIAPMDVVSKPEHSSGNTISERCHRCL